MRLVIAIGIIILVVSLGVYWQVESHEFINLDDNSYVCENANISTGLTKSNIIWAFTSVHSANWHPITWLSHMLDVQLFGMNPRGHHLVNVFIHLASTLLLLRLLFRLTNAPWQSALVAVLFALHPLHVESVAWVAERKDVLSAFFWFLALLFYAEYVTKRSRKFYLLSLFAFILGLMSKPMLVTLPVVMLLMDFWPLSRYELHNAIPETQQWRGNISTFIFLLKEKIPFIVCSLISAVITIYAQNKGGAIVSTELIPLWLRIENAVTAYGKYIVKMLWPTDLAVIYPFTPSIASWQVVCSLLILLAITAVTIRAGRRHPYLVVGWFWFLITLVPVIGLVQVGIQSMADRYTYIPSIGLFIFAAWGVPIITRTIPGQKYILTMLASVVIIASAAITWKQLRYWHDSISLYKHTLSVTTNNFLAHKYLGSAYAVKGQHDDAIEEYRKAMEIMPNDVDLYNNIGIALAIKGQIDAAIEKFKAAIVLDSNNIKAHNNLGYSYFNKGRLAEAIDEYQKALEIDPNFIEASNNLMLALEQQRRADKI